MGVIKDGLLCRKELAVPTLGLWESVRIWLCQMELKAGVGEFKRKPS